jgi:hypothetical protein
MVVGRYPDPHHGRPERRQAVQHRNRKREYSALRVAGGKGGTEEGGAGYRAEFG